MNGGPRGPRSESAELVADRHASDLSTQRHHRGELTTAEPDHVGEAERARERMILVEIANLHRQRAATIDRHDDLSPHDGRLRLRVARQLDDRSPVALASNVTRYSQSSAIRVSFTRSSLVKCDPIHDADIIDGGSASPARRARIARLEDGPRRTPLGSTGRRQRSASKRSSRQDEERAEIPTNKNPDRNPPASQHSGSGACRWSAHDRGTAGRPGRRGFETIQTLARLQHWRWLCLDRIPAMCGHNLGHTEHARN